MTRDGQSSTPRGSTHLPVFHLRFDHAEIEVFAQRHVEYWTDYWQLHTNESDQSDKQVEFGELLRQRENIGLTRSELIAACHWKSPRSVRHYERNEENYIQIVTTMALSSTNERLRIESLRLLQGVGWPMASAILHLAHEDRYPVLDKRALWSLNYNGPYHYDFEFWWHYTQFCRELADERQVSMRTLDRAIWYYATKHQPPGQLG